MKFKLLIPLFLLINGFCAYGSSIPQIYELDNKIQKGYFDNLPIIDTQDLFNLSNPDKLFLQNSSEDLGPLKILEASWVEIKPYQFINSIKYKEELGGLDIDIVSKVFDAIGVKVNFSKQNSWEEVNKSIQEGAKDLVAGVAYSKERAEYAYFSDPYRFEEDVLFVRVDNKRDLSFKNVEEFVAAARSLGFRVGITKGAVYGNDALDYFVNDHSNRDIVVKISEEVDFLKKIINNEIDVFINDKLIGTTMILENKLGGLISSIPLGISTPIRLMLSKKKNSPLLLEKLNESIKNIKTEGVFDKIKSKYLSRVLLLEAINSNWLNYVTLIGVVAFALSGVAIGAKDNMSLFSAILIGIMPSIPAAYIRDFIINDTSNSLFFSTLYILAAFIIVILGMSVIRLLDIYNHDVENEKIMKVFWTNCSTLSDVVGQSCFIVTGATYAALNEFQPIEIWGPICAFLVSDIGTVLRDLLTKNKQITSLSGSLNPEVAILWGLIFSIFMKFSDSNFGIYNISYIVTFVVIGGITSRLLLIKYKISNITFKSITLDSTQNIKT